MTTLACSNPGRIGDLLYSLPTAYALKKKYDAEPVDFYTSEYCFQVADILYHQDYIEKTIIDHEYIKTNESHGIQPWEMSNIPDKYDHICHLGYRRFPDKQLMYFTLNEYGFTKMPEGFTFHIPDVDPFSYDITEPYFAYSPRQMPNVSIVEDVAYITELLPVQIGISKLDGFFASSGMVDLMDQLSLIEAAALIKQSRFWLGGLSALTVIADLLGHKGLVNGLGNEVFVPVSSTITCVDSITYDDVEDFLGGI